VDRSCLSYTLEHQLAQILDFSDTLDRADYADLPEIWPDLASEHRRDLKGQSASKSVKAGSATKNKKSITSSETKNRKKTIWEVFTAALAPGQVDAEAQNTDRGRATGG
jgi:hypothetical protein